jgi:hypothetical protein
MRKPKTTLPDRKWLRLAREYGFTQRTGNRDCPLKKNLLAIGGWGVCVPHIEPDLQKILKRGRRFPGKSKSMRGERSRCHSNSAFCWAENEDKCSICTGYALSRDGMWRQHTWVYTHNGVVVETTEKRVAYFGFVMDKKECELFHLENC